MAEILETTVEKFTFRVPADRLYGSGGLWFRDESGGRVRVGATDYLQQHNGDVAFAEMLPVGTEITPGGDLGTIETIKATIALASPVAGVIVETNPLLSDTPEIINQDPYDRGWLVVMEVVDWPVQKSVLLAPPDYLAQVERLAREEVAS